jgi:hypothetical protein
MIFMSHYCRNLFAGLDTAPDVSATDVLLIADRDRPEATLAGIAWSWLEVVALDRSPRYRGIAVVSSADAIGVPDAGIASYRPVTERFR